ncbi:hypothetical protein B5M09_011783 [Aphanomyces astaci]|uniref:Uncharacterized protein n=1 Tax=Aphanomyces astaci TaxID=112090 RepID=A0A425DIZ0_APHAT|nr:hypothetical protein B5M09_011783 [Aphanomyces astaci]
MVATRATRQENPRALPTSVTEPVVDMSDADMDTQLDADDALIDGDVPQDVDMDADPPVTASSGKSAQRSNRAVLATARVPLHPASNARAAASRSFAPIPRVSSASARGQKNPTKILSRPTGPIPDSILPEDSTNSLEDLGISSVSDGPRPKSNLSDDPKNSLEVSGSLPVSDGPRSRPKSNSPNDPKNFLEVPGSMPVSDGRGRTLADFLPEDFEAGLASVTHVLPGRATNSLDQSEVVDDGLVPQSNFERHLPTFLQDNSDGDSATGVGQTARADVWAGVTPDPTLSTGLRASSTSSNTLLHDGHRDSAIGDGQTARAGVWAGVTPETTPSSGLRASSTSSDTAPQRLPPPSNNGPRTASKAAPAEDVWAFQAQQRAKASKTKSKDIGEHRPTMDELAPLLEKHAAGQLTFNDLLPIQKHSTRDVVGWLHMVTGAITKDIDVDTAMASLLFGNRDAGLDTALADIVKCEKDVPNRTIKWGVASEAALNKLRGVTMHIQVARNGAKQGFPMTSPHVLDGFFLDIPQGLQGVAEERLLFDVMARLGPRFLWGTYTSVSATTGLASSRYRLHFLGNTVPSSLHRDGRMVEEFVFLGRRLRVYGQGWYFRDKQLVRIDLDGVALKLGLYGKTVTRQDSRDTSTDPKPTKKAKVSHPSEPQWTTVQPARSKSNLSQRPGWTKPAPSRPWVSDNMFAALDERISIAPVTCDYSHGQTTVTVYTPKTTINNADCEFKTTGEFTSGTKIESCRPVRVECSLDAILAELEALDAKSIEVANHLPAQLEEACSKSSFNLASLVADGRVDSICSYLERSPIAFGIQLHQLFREDRPTFEYFVRQRLLHRWFRATWGGSKSFDHLYKAAFGQSISSGHTVALFSNPDFAAATKPLAITDTNGDDRELQWTEIEAVLALTEVLLAARATIYFVSDAAICASIKCPVTAIASHKGSRCLSSETLGVLLMETDLGTLLWETMEDMYSGDDDDDIGMRLTFSTILEFQEQGCLDVTTTNQVMFDPDTKCLTFGDVTAPAVTPLSG